MCNRKLRKITWEGEVIIINLTLSPSCNAENTNCQVFCAKNGEWNQPNKQFYYLLPYGVNTEIHNRTAWSLSSTVNTSTAQFSKLKIYASFIKNILSIVERLSINIYSLLEFQRTQQRKLLQDQSSTKFFMLFQLSIVL